jgi:short-subunit dehydrogenase
MNGTVVVITGASSGIGRATALRLARRDARLVLVSRRADALDELAKQCRARGGSAIAVPADVADAAAIDAVATRATVEFGRIDAWVNGAAVATYGLLEKVPLEEFRRVIDVNVMGVVNGTRAALMAMVRRKSGVVVNIASILAEVPQPYSAAYSMSKAAVRALGVSARSELALRGLSDVHVVTVLPPTIDTPFFRHAANHTGRKIRALPPVYPPELVARAIEAAIRHPRRPERVIGVLGRVLVNQHRRAARPVEAQVALQTATTNLSPLKPAGDSSGTLFDTDAAAEASVTGGWHGRSATTFRTAVGTVLAVSAAVWAVGRLGRRG